MELQLLYLACIGLAVLTSLVTFDSHRTPYKWFALLLFITLVMETSGYYMLKHKIEKNFIFHFYTPVQFTILSLLYHHSIHQIRLKRIIAWTLPFFLVFCIVNVAYLQKLKDYNSYGFMLKGILIVLWIMFFFYDLYHKNEFENPLKMPLFWISLGYLFFFSGTIFLNGYIEELMQTNMEKARQLFKINTFLNIFLYLSISYGLTCTSRNRLWM